MQQMKSFACELVRVVPVPHCGIEASQLLQFEYHHNPVPLWRAIHTQIAVDEAKHTTLTSEVFDEEDDDLENSLASSRHLLMPSISPYDLPPQGPKPLDIYATLTMRQM